MTDMRTKKLHMIFDMAEREFTVYVASPYNIFVDPRRKQVEMALSFFGLGELTDHEYRPTSENVQEWFPNLQIAPVYILKATLDRLPPGGIGQLYGEIAQQTGLRNVVLKVWSDDVTEEAEKKSTDALLSHQPGDHPDEKMYTADEAAALHGPKRIAAIMAELDRSDEEKYGAYATTTFAASSSALKEMFNKPFRKGVYQCRAASGEVIVENKLEEATDIKYFTTKEQIESHVNGTKHRTFLENVDYLAESNEDVRRTVAQALEYCDLHAKDIEVDVGGLGVTIIFAVAWLPLDRITAIGNALRRAGITPREEYIGVKGQQERDLFYGFSY